MGPSGYSSQSIFKLCVCMTGSAVCWYHCSEHFMWYVSQRLQWTAPVTLSCLFLHSSCVNLLCSLWVCDVLCLSKELSVKLSSIFLCALGLACTWVVCYTCHSSHSEHFLSCCLFGFCCIWNSLFSLFLTINSAVQAGLKSHRTPTGGITRRIWYQNVRENLYFSDLNLYFEIFLYNMVN